MTGIQKHAAIAEILKDRDAETGFFDGLDEAIIGLCGGCVVYDEYKATMCFVEQGMTLLEAREHMAFEIAGAQIHDNNPIFVEVLPEV